MQHRSATAPHINRVQSFKEKEKKSFVVFSKITSLRSFPTQREKKKKKESKIISLARSREHQTAAAVFSTVGCPTCLVGAHTHTHTEMRRKCEEPKRKKKEEEVRYWRTRVLTSDLTIEQGAQELRASCTITTTATITVSISNPDGFRRESAHRGVCQFEKQTAN